MTIWTCLLWLFFWPFMLPISFYRSKRISGTLKILITGIVFLIIMVGMINETYKEKPKTALRASLSSPTPEMLIYPKNWKTNTPVAEVVIYIGNKSFRLNGEDKGQYGRTVITNQNTPNQLSYIGYFLPAGIYLAENNTNYMNALNLYSSQTDWIDGVEYPSDSYGFSFQPGEKKSISVENGFYVKVIPPADFTLELVSQDLREPTSEPTRIPIVQTLTAMAYAVPLPTATPTVYHSPKNLSAPVSDSLSIQNSGSCTIKGNANANNGDKIYHCPGWRDYSRIEMNSAEGDRWFCSEAEARAAGFRDPDYPHGSCNQ